MNHSAFSGKGTKTIAELLLMPIMEGAEVIAAASSLDKVVKAVGIIDIYSSDTDYDTYFESNEYLKYEIMLSAYYPRFDEEEQCACIRFLHKKGASGLILYQPFGSNVTPGAINLANELSFPIIMMPSTNSSYSKLISELMTAIITDGRRGNSLVSYALGRMAIFSEQQRTFEALLELVFNYSQLYTGIYSNHLELIYSPSRNKKADEILVNAEYISKIPQAVNHYQSFAGADGSKYWFKLVPLNLIDSRISYISIIGPGHSPDQKLIDDIIETIRLYNSIWNSCTSETDALISAVINGELMQARKMSRSQGLSLSALTDMLIFKPVADFNKTFSDCGLLDSVDSVRRDNRIPGFSGIYNGCVVSLSSLTSTFRREQLEQYCADILSDYGAPIICASKSLVRIESAGAFFEIFNSQSANLKKVYPFKSLFTEAEVQLVDSCWKIIEQGKAEISQALSILSPLGPDMNIPKERIDTLSVYFLDADCVTERTAEILYTHQSTVKYRLKRIHELLGYDIRKAPEAFLIYKALIIMRLINMN